MSPSTRIDSMATNKSCQKWTISYTTHNLIAAVAMAKITSSSANWLQKAAVALSCSFMGALVIKLRVVKASIKVQWLKR